MGYVVIILIAVCVYWLGDNITEAIPAARGNKDMAKEINNTPRS